MIMEDFYVMSYLTRSLLQKILLAFLYKVSKYVHTKTFIFASLKTFSVFCSFETEYVNVIWKKKLLKPKERKFLIVLLNKLTAHK